MKSFTFRQKVLFSYLALFLSIVLVLYPLAIALIHRVQERDTEKKVEALISKIERASSEEQLLERLKKEEQLIFFHVTLLTDDGNILYDSQELAGESELIHPEFEEALAKGKGFDIRHSPLFDQEMAYTAEEFDFLGKEYVLRAAFPFESMAAIGREFTLTFLFFTIGILLIFGVLAWGIFHVLTKPIQLIINAILPYQRGETDHIPEIYLEKSVEAKDEFTKLAETLNSLSRKIQEQIRTLTEERNDKEEILQSLGEGVIAVDDKNRLIFMNRVAEELLDIQSSELLGSSFENIGQPLLIELLREAKEESRNSMSIFTPEKKKPRLFIDAIAAPRGSGGILVLQDKTSLHKIIESGKDFIANASHELKTPITIIRGFAETMHDHPELSEQMIAEITGKMVANCHRMETLVRNLLTLASMDEGLPPSRLVSQELFPLIDSVKQMVVAVHPDAEISIKIEGTKAILVRMDADLFSHALLNLLDNAAKYSPAPAKIKVEVRRKEGKIEIEVQDQGVGIPPEDLDRIFERFYAVDKSHSRRLGGSGLGLSIVDRIIDRHYGEIHISSEVGKGTTFTISLPGEE